ncbi:YdaS family helix-turn-helix protein [Vogesella sp. EB]|uniref:transcriptional regulator n=1 Tax=Vogesella sp. EB TaxID=1526735 RepID=UPI0009E5CC1C|nr:YdaS family helix-turn-helix protein [Vogesella sp. EB]
MTNSALDRAWKIAGSKAALAKLAGVKPPVIQQWLKGERPIPPARCVLIEKGTGGAVTRQELRPDDWLQLWPELNKAA